MELSSVNFICIHLLDLTTAGLEINLDVIPVIMTGGSLNLPVTAEVSAGVTADLDPQ
jgi:hypothetical protein